MHSARLPGKPDIVFSRMRVAVFVDGDFWHGNQWRIRGLDSLEHQFVHSTNASYWIEKIRRNVARDHRATEELQASGWKVIRLWESQLRSDFVGCVDVIEGAVRERSEND